MYPGGGPVRAGMESFGFPAHFHDMLHEFPICHVNALLAGTLDTAAKDTANGRAFFFLLAAFFQKWNGTKGEMEQNADCFSCYDTWIFTTGLNKVLFYKMGTTMRKMQFHLKGEDCLL